jgi:hypothetical protein
MDDSTVGGGRKGPSAVTAFFGCSDSARDSARDLCERLFNLLNVSCRFLSLPRLNSPLRRNNPGSKRTANLFPTPRRFHQALKPPAVLPIPVSARPPAHHRRHSLSTTQPQRHLCCLLSPATPTPTPPLDGAAPPRARRQRETRSAKRWLPRVEYSARRLSLAPTPVAHYMPVILYLSPSQLANPPLPPIHPPCPAHFLLRPNPLQVARAGDGWAIYIHRVPYPSNRL